MRLIVISVQMLATMFFNQSDDPKRKTNLIVGPVRDIGSSLLAAHTPIQVALLYQWKEEIETKTTGKPKILLYHGHGRPRGLNAVEEISGYDFVLTTYGTVSAEWPGTPEYWERQAKKKARRRVMNDFIDEDSAEEAKAAKKKKGPPAAGPIFKVSTLLLVSRKRRPHLFPLIIDGLVSCCAR